MLGAAHRLSSKRAEDEQTCEEKKNSTPTLSPFFCLPPSLLFYFTTLSKKKTGSYEGDSDLQLERVNVYFNEATGGEF